MSKSQQYIKDLFQRYIRNTISKEDYRLLTEYFNITNKEDLLKQIIRYHIEEDLHTKDEKGMEKSLSRVENFLHKHIQKQSPKKKYIGYFIPYAAAVLLICLSSYFVWKNYLADQKVTLSPSITQEIAPGRDQAFLTLSDGQIIHIDSLNSGSLVNQQGAVVVKEKDGSLTYRLDLNGGKKTTEENLFNTITTPRGGQYKVVLPDQSSVWLNAESSLRFPIQFSKNERRVYLTGEGYFEIKKNPSKPFIVEAKDQTVRVLGTAFNIKAHDATEVRTALIHGLVKIRTKNRPQKDILLQQQGDATILAKGYIRKIKVDIAEETAWRKGIFSFNHKDFGTIMQELGRWYNLQIDYPNGIPHVELVGDAYRNQNLSMVLRILKVAEVNYHIDTEKRILTIFNNE